MLFFNEFIAEHGR